MGKQLQVVQQGHGRWASSGTSSTGVAERAIHKSTPQIILNKSCDTLIVLSQWWLELKQRSVQMQAIITERADKTRGAEEQDADLGLARQRRPSRSKHAAQEGRRWVLYYRNSHISTFYCFCAKWRSEEHWEPTASWGMRPDKGFPGYPAAQCHAETLALPQRGGRRPVRQTP